MSTVIHPVGPEPSEKYWVRRAVVIGVALLLVIVLLVALFNRNASQQPAPAAPPGTPTSLLTSASPSASPSSSSSSSATASAGSSTKASTTPSTKASATSSTKASDSATSSTKASTSATSSGKASASAKQSGSPSASASGGSSASAKASPSPSSSAPSSATTKSTATPTAAANQKTLVVCDPAQLRPTLTAPERSVKAKKSVTFSMSLINGSTGTCVVTVKPTDFELKIYSGKDRIWSTNDCGTLVEPKLAEVKPEKSLQWKISWNGRRSAKGCENRSEIPRAGTYWATAQFTGSKPVQFRFLVK